MNVSPVRHGRGRPRNRVVVGRVGGVHVSRDGVLVATFVPLDAGLFSDRVVIRCSSFPAPLGMATLDDEVFSVSFTGRYSGSGDSRIYEASKIVYLGVLKHESV